MSSPSSNRWLRRILIPVGFVALAGGSWFALRGKATQRHAPSADQKVASVKVEVTTPHAGGIDRMCVQPGTFEPFEAADLYAKVSGFLIEQKVDIGSRVKEGDVLARIAVPEHEKQVQKDTADVRKAEAKVAQSRAAIATAEADVKSASAAIALAQAELKSKSSYRAYRQKQRDRIKELFAQRAIDAKLVDEQEDQHEAAIAAQIAAGEAVNAARQKEAAAKAKVEEARADEDFAEAEVVVAKALLEKSSVLLDYAIIRSPYTGVVTRRSFNRGDFVRSADSGGDRIPLLSVERTDVMRVVIQVPDRDVPFVNPGDPAVVTIDALPGVTLQTNATLNVAVSRAADSEDTHTRTMRTEVDVPNTDGTLRRGMYGRVALNLQSGSASAVRVPSGAIGGRGEAGKARVRVVRQGRIQTIPVVVGADNGVEVEVLAGLTAADKVVVRASAAVEDGESVTETEAKAATATATH